MDVDAAARQIGGEIVRQYLHVAGQHDQFRAGFLDHRLDLRFLLRLRFLGDGQVVIRNVADHRGVERRHRMVRHDADHFHRQFADAMAVEQVAQAVIELRYQQQYAPPFRRIAQAPIHLMIGGNGGKGRAQLADVIPWLCQLGHNAHEEQPAFTIVELLGFKDIPPMRGEERGDGGDQARPVGTGQGEDAGLGQSIPLWMMCVNSG